MSVNLFTPDEQGHIILVKAFLRNLSKACPVLSSQMILAGGRIAREIQKVESGEPLVLDDADTDVFVLCPTNVEYVTSFDEFTRWSIGQSKESKSTRTRFIYKNLYSNIINKHIRQVVEDTDTNIQYIFTDYPDRKALIDDFDFEHCCASYDINKDELYITRKILDCIVKKNLIARIDPASWRTEKFKSLGYRHQNTD